MPTSDDCRDIVRQLWPYLDGALPDEWQERVSAHLERCETCCSHVDYAREFLAAVRASEEAGDGYGALEARVLAALRAEGMSRIAAP